VDFETVKQMLVRFPTRCYEADIREDIILLYQWCHSEGMDVVALEHGLRCRRDGRSGWILGARDGESFSSIALVGVDEGKWAFCNGPNQGDVVDALRSTGLRVMTLNDGPDSGSDVCLSITDWP